MNGWRVAVVVACALSALGGMAVFAAVSDPVTAAVVTFLGAVLVGVATSLAFGRGDR